MATRLTKKQQSELTEKLSGIIQKNNALQLRMSTDTSVNEMNVNQISGELNRIHYRAIGKDLPTEINIPVKQLGSGDPSPDNIRPIVGYEIDGIGTVYGGDLNIETRVLTATYGVVDLGTLSWGYSSAHTFFYANISGRAQSTNIIADRYINVGAKSDSSMDTVVDKSIAPTELANGQIKIKDTSYTDAASFKAAMSGVMLVYELATPKTYTLTLQQMIQLLDQL